MFSPCENEGEVRPSPGAVLRMLYCPHMSFRSLLSSKRAPQMVFWMFASLAALPASLLYFSSRGVSALSSFLLGILATLLVLFLNMILEGSLWMFHAEWRHIFERPDASLRLVVVAGALLLIVETMAIMYLLVSPGADEAFLVLVRQHRCLVPEPNYQDLCQLLTNR